MSERRILYHFAFLRVVPHPHMGAFANVGVVLHARTEEYLGMRVVTDPDALRRIAAEVDLDLLVRYLGKMQQICEGDPAGGQIALLPPSERFHWLTAPRSDVLQASPVHEGVCDDPEAALEKLFSEISP